MAQNITGSAEITDALIPEKHATEIIQDVTKSSVVLSNARKTRMGTKTERQPVLDALPTAKFVDGETGLKSVSRFSFKDAKLIVEELAVILPIPDSVVDDAAVDLWSVARPLAAEAIGAALDGAVLFGTDKPTTWGAALVPGAIAAGNVVKAGTGMDLGVDVARLGQLTAKGGGQVKGFVSEPGLRWELAGLRSAQGAPIYGPAIAEGQPDTLYGLPLNPVETGVWVDDAAKLAAVDWQKVVIGVRQDITYDVFREGVITEADGSGGQKIVYNLMQQDMKALRVVFRVAYATAQPVARVSGKPMFPAGVLTPATA